MTETEKDLRKTHAAVLDVAVAAIYFDDNSDYRTALYEIVELINSEACDLLEDDPEAAFQTYCE